MTQACATICCSSNRHFRSQQLCSRFQFQEKTLKCESYQRAMGRNSIAGVIGPVRSVINNYGNPNGSAAARYSGPWIGYVDDMPVLKSICSQRSATSSDTRGACR